jgi:membrane protease YdiL (CAAX protease family)
MKIKPSQKRRIQSDFRVGMILVLFVCFVFAIQILRIPISVSTTILSMLVFIILLAGYLLLANATLTQVAREHVLERQQSLAFVPTSLFTIYFLYALLLGKLAWLDLLMGLLYCTIPLLLIWQLRHQTPALTWLDTLVILLFWLPIEFNWIPALSLPPVQGLIKVYHLNGIILILIAYLMVRGLADIGFTWRLKGADIRTAIQNFIFFMPIVLIVGFATGFLALSRHVPSGTEMLAMFVNIAFFIAIPEELLFRGIIHNLIEKRLQGRKHHVWIALTISSVIFGLAHGNNFKAPLLDINLGFLGVWHCPWAYLILATLGGFFYGLTFMMTKKITAAALVHLLVNWTWVVFLNG